METLLTIDDVAQKLNLSKRTIYKYVYEGTLPAIKLGNKWQFREQDIEDFIASAKGNK